jgi:hypothetical protein
MKRYPWIRHNEPTQEQDEGQADNFEAQAELDQRG